tara:strand:- start:999 stop:1397 length:399 start_codon:yes stop_codon:yes gene_type:complete
VVQESIKEQMGIVVKVKDNVVSYNHQEPINCKELIKWFGGKDYKTLILTKRLDDGVAPHEDVINELRFKFRKNLYLFIQDPWPEPLKDFDIDDKTFVLRFTYDEGCEMDRGWRDWETEDGYYMLTKDEIVKL